jgi:glycosyltransferase involved in cell wall biosynthesis
MGRLPLQERNKSLKKSVIHLVPYNGVGGVEEAALTTLGMQNSEFEYELKFIYPHLTSIEQRGQTYNPVYLFKNIVSLAKKRPGALIVSLWRSALVGIFLKLYRPQTKLILFLHNTKDAHFMDYVITRFASRLADEVWSDSDASLKARLPSIRTKKTRVISFVTKKLCPLSAKPAAPQFIFWGRITSQKNLSAAVQIFSKIHAKNTDAKFIIIGPDGGQLEGIQRLCDRLSLLGCVEFTGPKEFEQITKYAEKASFYLQTSDYEGMAMSVVESMQLGLVPVVTPVGQIGEYCKQGINSVVVSSESQAVESIFDLLADDVKYQTLKTNAITTWNNKPIYRDSFLSACRDVAI